MKQVPSNIIISRTDSIGDVVLTLPVAKVLKDFFPSVKIGFLGKAYTKGIIEACKYVDEFIELEYFLNKPVTVCGESAEAIIHVFPVAKIARRAKQLQIPRRIGTTNRLYHWLSCNELVKLSRKKSLLHEAQLNLKLLKPFGIDSDCSLDEIGNSFGLERLEPLGENIIALIEKNRYNLILHPKSQGSAREWGLQNFIDLVKLLDPHKYRIFISGTRKEREKLQPLFDAVTAQVVDITGTMDLKQFISFINHCDGLVANSTGPLHIAAALGKEAFGIYPPLRPIDPGRWAPLGPNAKFFVLDKSCTDCKGNTHACSCIEKVKPEWIQSALEASAFKGGKPGT